MSITKKLYGKMPEGTDVFLYKLTNSKGMFAEITNYGGIIVSLVVPDRNGKFEDITTAFANLDGYFTNSPYFGAVLGRVANRIEDAAFVLNGVKYNVAVNDGPNHLHGGLKGFNKVLWQSEIIQNEGTDALQLTYRSVDGEENYPGNLDVKVIYTLTEDNGLRIDYFAVSDKDTVINMTNHAYFNLAGHAFGNILSHTLKINADKFTPCNSQCLPTGEIREVKGTVMDFTNHTPFAPGLESNDEQIKFGFGYDHNFVLNTCGNLSEIAAELYEPGSGRLMEVYTTKPGVQFYSGNHINVASNGKDGAVYTKRSALCLETQFFPNAMKHEHFPSPILRAGETYNYTTIYKFTTK